MSLSDVTARLEALEEHYRDYTYLDPEQPPKPKGFGKLFRRWFTYNAQEIEPVHQQFLEGTETLVKELAEAVSSLSDVDREAGIDAADRAVSIMLGEKPEGLPNDRRLYLIAAESLAAPLLPLLDRDRLSRQRESMLSLTPKRLMFPKQLALLGEMEELLGKHGANQSY